MGKIVETISHSPVWKESAIFGVEDDTQNGVDHVDGHRGPAFVISPYSKGGVDHEYASQPNMVKTVEQMLGIKPMNQEDYAAEPMYGAFTEHPNFAPYTALPNKIPLTLGVKGFPEAPGGPSYVPQDDAGRPRRPGTSGRASRSSRASTAARTRPSRSSSTATTGTPPTTGGAPTPATRRSTCPSEVPGRKIPAAVAGD